MLNRPNSSLSDHEPGGTSASGIDRHSQIRFVLLWLMMVVPVMLIWGRVAHLQLALQNDYVAGFSVTTEVFEEIPAQDGRIFAADQTLLAGDVQEFAVAVHYPAIQEIPDDGWISGKARLRLSKSDRKDKSRLAAEKQKVIAENERLWTKLAELTQRPLDEILEARRTAEARVVQMKESVRRRYRERKAEADAQAAQQDTSAGAWNALWRRLQRATSESPDRSRGPRLIAEELDYCTVINDVSAEIKDEIEAHPERYPYTRVIVTSRRTYPQQDLACHLIGARKPLSGEQLKERRSSMPEGDPQDYRVGDPCGLFGLERSYDVHLKGIRGQRALVKDRRGEIVKTRIVREPRPGRDLVLTLETEIQRKAEQLLDEALTKVTMPGTIDVEANQKVVQAPTCPQGGCLVALDVNTGAIIAAAAAPRFDLNLYVAPDTSLWEDVLADPRSPFLARATQMALPPGSVFKVISAVASIESGKMPPDAMFHCRGFLDRPDQHRCLPFRHQGVGHYDVTLADALCRSCNVYFYAAARRMGPQTLVDWARQFGVGQPTGVDLPTEAAGNLPAPDRSLSADGRQKPWKPGATLGMAIGQDEVTMTPLQVARVMAAIANNGHLVTPHLAASSGPVSIHESGTVDRSFRHDEPRPISGLRSDTLDRVRDGLTMVVNDPKGTGYKTVRLKEVTIAGKTGTAEKEGRVDHAWFAGYVPAERPRIAFVVVLEHGGSGGKAAGPVAREFVKILLDTRLVVGSAELADGHSPKASAHR